MNIVIDGNAFLNVSTSIVKNMLQNDKRIGEKYYVSDLLDDSKFMLKDQAAMTFKKFVLNYFSSIISPFKGGVGAVYFVFDSKSWRKDYIKQFFKEEEIDPTFAYKGSRKYDDKMYLFFDLFQNEILLDLKDFGAVSARIIGAEGDDLIAHIVDKIDGDICVWSVDKDLIQLLENKRRSVILVTPKMMTKNKRVFVSSVKKKEAAIDIFNLDEDSINSSAIDEVIKELLNRDFVKYEVDPTQELIVKILGGDDSDSIPRVHPKMTKSKLEAVISKLKEDTISWEELMQNIRKTDLTTIDKITKISSLELKLNTQELQDQFSKALVFNIKLICLDIKQVPEPISELIQESFNFNEVKRFDTTAFKKYHSIK